MKLKYVFSFLMFLSYSMPMLAQSFGAPMYLPEMKIGHADSVQSLHKSLEKSFPTSLILTDERAKDYFVLGFYNDRVFLFKNQMQIGELNGYPLEQIQVHIDSLEQKLADMGFLRRNSAFFTYGLGAYLLNSMILMNLTDISSWIVAIVVGAFVQLHKSPERKAKIKSLLSIKYSLEELKGSPTGRVYTEMIPGVGEALKRIRLHHQRQKYHCSASAS